MSEIVATNWPWLMVIGVAAGTLSSMLGIGGGVLVVPALVLGLGVGQKSAQGVSLAMMIPMALMGALRYWWNPAIKLDIVMILVLVPCAIIGANVGSSIAAAVPALVLRRLFGVFVIVVGVKMLWPR
jgi:uncharacterized protein